MAQVRRIPKKVVLRAELVFNNGRFDGFILRASSDSERKLIDDLMNGTVPGLEYCENKKIRPFAGGDGAYLLKVS
ncbi:MAG TPA: hypothetical protein VJC06_01155 [Candidatus Paceibacterota bacterium]